MNILITGGTGFIGSYLRTLLLREGHLLTIVTRSPGKYESETAQNQRFVSWNADFNTEMKEADAVINLVGESIFGQRWTDEVKQEIYSSRIDNTLKLASAINEVNDPPSVMISASGIDYYSDKGDEFIDESGEPGNDFLSNVCRDWEKAANEVTEAGVRVAIPRFGIALETGGGALQQMMIPFKLFVGGSVGSGKQYFSWIHMHDLCRGIIFALENDHFNGAYNLCAPNPVTMNEFADSLGDILNRPSLFRVPEFAMKLALGEAADPVINSLRVQPKRLQQEGFEFRFEHVSEALSEIFE